MTFIDADGARHAFTNPVIQGTVTTYTRPATLYATLVKDTGNAVEFTLTYRDQSRDTFDIFGTTEALLTRAEDRYGNGVTLAYVGGTNRIATITDTAGSRTVDFAYDGSNRLTSITDWAWINAGVVQSTATGAKRQYRFFYRRRGYPRSAGPIRPTRPAPVRPPRAISPASPTRAASSPRSPKTQTYTTLTSGVLGTGSRQVATQVLYAGAEVSTVKNAEEGGGEGPLISRTVAGETQVVRQGSGSASLDATTKYVQPSATDSLGRISSAKRKLGAAWIEGRTTYDATYPIEPATVVDNYVNGMRRRRGRHRASTTGRRPTATLGPRSASSPESSSRSSPVTRRGPLDRLHVQRQQRRRHRDRQPGWLDRRQRPRSGSSARSCWSTQGATLPSDHRDCRPRRGSTSAARSSAPSQAAPPTTTQRRHRLHRRRLRPDDVCHPP